MAIAGLIARAATGEVTVRVVGVRAEQNRKMGDAQMELFVQELMERIINGTGDDTIELIRDQDGNNRFRAGGFKPVIVNGAAVRQSCGLLHAAIRRAYQALNLAGGGGRLWYRAANNAMQPVNVVNNWQGPRIGLVFVTSYSGVKAKLREMSQAPAMINDDNWEILKADPTDDAPTTALKTALRSSALLHRAACRDDLAAAQQVIAQTIQLTVAPPGQLPDLEMRTTAMLDLPCWFVGNETLQELANDDPAMPLLMKTVTIAELIKNRAQHWPNTAAPHRPTFQDVVDTVAWLQQQGPQDVSNEFPEHQQLIQIV